jgi:hypothetical protein
MILFRCCVRYTTRFPRVMRFRYDKEWHEGLTLDDVKERFTANSGVMAKRGRATELGASTMPRSAGNCLSSAVCVFPTFPALTRFPHPRQSPAVHLDRLPKPLHRAACGPLLTAAALHHRWAA